jgi:uroporphyrinogen decarboxylase
MFNPELYSELFFPYHKELANLCHSYNAYVHMHSHGNILKVFPLLIEAGIDMVNPCDPYEFKDIEYLKNNFGDKIILVGGMDKFISEWDRKKMREFLAHVINVGRKNGGLILMDSGEIPENISQETYDYYVKVSKEFRYKKS